MNNKKILGIAVFAVTLIAALGIIFFKNKNTNLGLKIPFISSPQPTPTESVKGADSAYEYDSSAAEPHEPQPFENNPADDPAFTYKDDDLTAITGNPDADTVHLSSDTSEYIGIFFYLNQGNLQKYALVATLEVLPDDDPRFYQIWVKTKNGQTTSLGKLSRTPVDTYAVKGETSIPKSDITGVYVSLETTEDNNPETIILKADATNQ